MAEQKRGGVMDALVHAAMRLDNNYTPPKLANIDEPEPSKPVAAIKKVIKK